MAEESTPTRNVLPRRPEPISVKLKYVNGAGFDWTMATTLLPSTRWHGHPKESETT
jgi:hypothetical protein